MILNRSPLKFCSKKKCNTLINVLYWPPSGFRLPFENFLKDRFNKTKNSNKMLQKAGDFNKNLLEYEKCKNSMIPTINKPTRVTRQGATAIDHILTNCFVMSLTIFQLVSFYQ